MKPRLETIILSLLLSSVTASSLESADFAVLAGENTGGDLSLDIQDYAVLGDACKRRWDSQQKYYAGLGGTTPSIKIVTCFPDEITDPSTGERYYLTCDVAENDSGFDGANGIVEIDGICQRTACAGTNDVLDISAATPAAGTESHRVTVCHRIQSNPNNPWVRITIDKAAWEKPQDHCGSTQPNATWDLGDSFIIKDHGTREYISQQFDSGNDTVTANGAFVSEKDYWHYWERACPYSRQSPDNNNPCCGLNGDYSDCCERPTEVPSASPYEAEVSRNLDTDCPSEPTDAFTKDIYITFMGKDDAVVTNVATALVDSGIKKKDLEDAIQNEYNKLGGDGHCVYYNRKIENVKLDMSDANQVLSFNRDYQFTGFRVKATVSGVCTNCEQHLLLPEDQCKVTQTTSCSTCTSGNVIQIAGKDLYPKVNSVLGLDNKSAEIFRIQGDVTKLDPQEPECGTDETKFIKPTGQASCL